VVRSAAAGLLLDPLCCAVAGAASATDAIAQRAVTIDPALRLARTVPTS
jgi:hypothetical protein